MLGSSIINSVCFTGHRDLTNTEVSMLAVKLAQLLKLLIQNRRLQYCYAGGAIGFDTLASLTVLNLQKTYPELKLNLILPCTGQESKWSLDQRKIYDNIKQRANNVRILSPFFYNGCMQARNKELLLSSDLCIAYLRHDTSVGGSLNTVIQATKLGIPVINLADPESEYINEISQ